MKLIKVSGCHECPYCYNEHVCQYPKAYFLDSTGVVIMKVGVEYSEKTLPDNCPLEESPKTGFGSAFDGTLKTSNVSFVISPYFS